MASESHERGNDRPAVTMGAVSAAPALDQLLPLLLAVQKELGDVSKDSENPHFHNRYASLSATLAHIKPSLNKRGVLVVQGAHRRDDWIEIGTTLIHADSGQWLGASFYCQVPSGDPQKVAAATTYGRRYTPAMLLAIASGEDDDAESVVSAIRDNDVLLAIEAQIPKDLSAQIRELKWTKAKVRTEGQRFFVNGELDIKGFSAVVSAALDAQTKREDEKRERSR